MFRCNGCRVIATIAVVLLLSGCTAGLRRTTPSADGARDAAAVSTGVYICDKGYRFVARYRDGDVWVFLPSGTVQLPQVPAASGTKYSNGEVMLWSRGDEAMLDAAGSRRAGCMNDRRAAVWEHAKLSGVDFRAIGNEPGWVLEISNRSDILFIADYGSREYRFADASMESDRGTGEALYRASAGADQIAIRLIAGECSDTMSGERFESAVSVELNGRRYQGCGRALH